LRPGLSGANGKPARCRPKENYKGNAELRQLKRDESDIQILAILTRIATLPGYGNSPGLHPRLGLFICGRSSADTSTVATIAAFLPQQELITPLSVAVHPS
jgi:hypothetical protein